MNVHPEILGCDSREAAKCINVIPDFLECRELPLALDLDYSDISGCTECWIFRGRVEYTRRRSGEPIYGDVGTWENNGRRYFGRNIERRRSMRLRAISTLSLSFDRIFGICGYNYLNNEWTAEEEPVVPMLSFPG